MMRKSVACAVAIGGLSVVLLAVGARAGGDKVVFPADYDKGVLYTTVDRPDNKQYRESRLEVALDAVKRPANAAAPW